MIEINKLSQDELFRYAIIFLDNKTKGITFEKLVDEEYQNKRIPIEFLNIYREVYKRNENILSSKSAMSELMRKLYKLQFADKKKSEEDLVKLKSHLNKIFHLRELKDKNQGSRLKKALESDLQLIYDNHKDKTDDLLENFHGANLFLKYDQAMDRIDMLMDDLKLPDYKDIELNEHDDKIDKELEKKAGREQGKHQWKRDINDEMLMKIFNKEKSTNGSSDYPVYFETDFGLKYDIPTNQVSDRNFQKIVIPASDLNDFYNKSNNNFETFKELVAGKYEKYFSRLKGNYRNINYDPIKQIHGIGEAILSLSESDRELVAVKAGKGNKKKAWAFKNAKALNGTLLHTIDTSSDVMGHDQVKIYLDTRAGDDPDVPNMKASDFNRIKIEHIKDNKVVQTNYASIDGVIDSVSGQWKPYAIGTLNERLSRQMRAQNDLQFNYMQDNATFDRNKAKQDWLKDLIKAFNSVKDQDLYDENPQQVWMQKIDPIFWGRGLGRKQPYYYGMFSQKEILTVFHKGGGAKYWKLVTSHKQAYNANVMNKFIEHGMKMI